MSKKFYLHQVLEDEEVIPVAVRRPREAIPTMWEVLPARGFTHSFRLRILKARRTMTIGEFCRGILAKFGLEPPIPITGVKVGSVRVLPCMMVPLMRRGRVVGFIILQDLYVTLRREPMTEYRQRWRIWVRVYRYAGRWVIRTGSRVIPYFDAVIPAWVRDARHWAEARAMILYDFLSRKNLADTVAMDSRYIIKRRRGWWK